VSARPLRKRLLYQQAWPYEARGWWSWTIHIYLFLRYADDHERWPWSRKTRRDPWHGFKALEIRREPKEPS